MDIYPSSKVCYSCEMSKSLEDFYKDKGCKYGRANICKECHKSRMSKIRNNRTKEEKRIVYEKYKVWKETDPNYKDYHKKYWHKNKFHRYGITEDDYNKMLTNQEYRCKICGSTPEIFHTDHCHETGKVRGLLCITCNVGLGSFRDSEKLLLKAIEYLKQ